jgi:hypothetical protein
MLGLDGLRRVTTAREIARRDATITQRTRASYGCDAQPQMSQARLRADRISFQFGALGSML